MAHRKAADVLGREGLPLLSATEIWEIAEHWVAAAENSRALEAFQTCAQHAIKIGRPREAAIALSRALRFSPNDEVRASLGREMLLAASACGEFALAKEGMAAWREFSKELVHDAAELAELRTRALLAVDVEATFERLLACAAFVDASRPHRFAAGANAVKIVHYEGRSSLAERARGLLTHLCIDTDDDHHALEFSIIYHCTLGDLDSARENALRLCAISQGWSQTDAAVIQQNVAFALWVAGAADEAILGLEECYRNAEQAGLVRLRLHAALTLVFFNLDVDDASATNTRLWLRRAQKDAAQWPDQSFGIHFALAETQLALFDGDAVQAKRELQRFCAFAPRYRTDTRWMEVMTYRVQQLSGDASLPGLDLDPLVIEATSLPRKEIADTEIAVAADALLARGDVAAGTDLVKRYLGGMRCRRSPLDFHLARSAKRLGLHPGSQR
jgi:hypothetical protein